MLPYRIGIGHDTHRLEPGGPLRLGGIDVPFDRQAVGHSDADVLLHAITDALLGAVALGDIGEMFPDTAAENRGRDSGQMLELAFQKVWELGYRVNNLDCIVFAERPKLKEYKSQIAARIAGLLRIETSQVSVKAKTGEGVDAIGTLQAIAAQCVVLLVHRENGI
ncbi:MAG: 2-C-methyl-D-erythritol 2,4-cyclodiphosphate synthase [Pirellulaceae bacterium]